MCEFCHTHGEGKKWYLQARNYSQDLLADLDRRRMVEAFFADPGHLRRSERSLDLLDRLPPVLRRAVAAAVVRRQKERHFGQVVPIEDAERIFQLVNSVVRLACICRQTTAGREERYCYGLSLAPGGGRMAEILRGLGAGYLTGPETAGLEALDKAAALAALRDCERQGLCHTIWTFGTPFIAGLCNCNQRDCYAMRAAARGVRVFFPGEYAAALDRERCTGCLSCLALCQFGALRRAGGRAIGLEAGLCQGCGICRSACPTGALRLVERPVVGDHRG